MATHGLKDKTIKGTVWSAVDRFSALGIQFVVSVIMARLLTPEDYGLIGMLGVFLAVANALIDSGFSQALIQKQNRTDVDYSTVMFFNITVSLFLYFLLFYSAPLISNFYDEPMLTPLTRVLGLSLIINSFSVVQKALFTIRIDFKTQTKASLSAAVISGFIGIVSAYVGVGVWALVIQQLINFSINVVLLWIYGRWKPLFVFSIDSFKSLFAYGSKLMLSGLINTLWINIYSLVIGKFFSKASLGYYTRANQFTELPSSSLTMVMQRVTFPVMCQVQDDKDRFISIFRSFLRMSAFVIFPVMMFIAGVSEPLILILLGDQWSFCSTLLTIICFASMWYPVHAINLNPISALGHSDLFLKLEIYKKIVGIVVLAITIPFGLVWVCYGSVISSLLMLFINSFYTKKLVGYGIFEQIKDLAPSLLLSILMFLILESINVFIESYFICLFIDFFVAVIFYIGSSELLHLSELDEVKNLACQLKKHKYDGR